MPIRHLRIFPALFLSLITGCISAGPNPPAVARSAPAAPVAFRIVEAATGEELTLHTLAHAVGAADVVLFGEMHADSIGHAVQLALLREIGRRHSRVILGLEMLERDVQPVVEEYLSGTIGQETFREGARVWANYVAAYAPLVELTRKRGWRVLATNLPQEQASRIAQEGLESLDRMDAADRTYAAAENRCPRDEYWDRFVEALTADADSTAHTARSATDPMFGRMYAAQCARDEAMAEAIAGVPNGTLLYHVNGGFHSDFGLGIVPRLLRRRPELEIAVISAVPVADPSQPRLAEHRDRADYLIFTRE